MYISCNRFVDQVVVHKEPIGLGEDLPARPRQRLDTLIGEDSVVDDSTDPFAALDRSIADTARHTRLEGRIYRRVRDLMREHGLAYDYCEEKALEQATLELTGTRAR